MAIYGSCTRSVVVGTFLLVGELYPSAGDVLVPVHLRRPDLCYLSEGTVDWRFMLQVYHVWATNRSVAFMETIVLGIHATLREGGRIKPSDPCFIGSAAAGFAAASLGFVGQTFLYSSHSAELRTTFRWFQDLSWRDVSASRFGKPVFASLAALGKLARETCSTLRRAPTVPANSGLLRCVTDETQREQDTRIIGTGAQATGRWCGEWETPAMSHLWETAWKSLSAGKPTDELVLAARRYSDGNIGNCAEADTIAWLTIQWAYGTGASSDDLFMLSIAQKAMSQLDFVHTIFTRWPVWDFFSTVSTPWPPIRVEPSSCFAYAGCERTAAFYRNSRSPKHSLPRSCPQIADGLIVSYKNGTLTVQVEGGTTRLTELQILDTSHLKQQRNDKELRETFAKDWGWDSHWRLHSENVPLEKLPLRLGYEGLQLRTKAHIQDQAEFLMEPQYLPEVEIRRRANGHQISSARRPSIYLLVLESASRSGFEAFCPQSMEFLREQTNWQVFDFPRFHALLGGTAENMLPGLSGLPFREDLNAERRSTSSCNAFKDEFPDDRFLWNILKSEGYVTAFGSSACNGILGTRWCSNWLEQFDHVPPTLELAYPCSSYDEWGRAFRSPEYGCVGSKRPHEHLLEYFRRFFEIYRDGPAFAYLHLETAHDKQESMQILDNAIKEHLIELAKLPNDDQPVIVLAGDHGPQRYCDAISPLAMVLVPTQSIATSATWASYAWGLRQNSFSIVSWFDMYATLRHFATGTRPTAEDLAGPQRWDCSGHISQSLLQALPTNRTCEQAGIPEWQCGCSQQWLDHCPIAENSVRDLLKGTLKHIDREINRIPGSSVCPRLVLTDLDLCETQLKSYKLMQEMRDDSNLTLLIRGDFSTEQGMEYRAYVQASIVSKPYRAISGWHVLKVTPISEYRRHEGCTPVGADPAFCACASREP